MTIHAIIFYSILFYSVVGIFVKILFSTVQDQVGWTGVDQFGPVSFWVCRRPVTMETRHILERQSFYNRVLKEREREREREKEKQINLTKDN